VIITVYNLAVKLYFLVCESDKIWSALDTNIEYYIANHAINREKQ